MKTPNPPGVASLAFPDDLELVSGELLAPLASEADTGMLDASKVSLLKLRELTFLVVEEPNDVGHAEGDGV